MTIGTARNTTASQRLVRFFDWNAKISTKVSNNAPIITGWNFGRKVFSNHSRPCDLSKTILVSQPAVKGMTRKTTTDVIKTFAGTTTCATPQRNMTIGANARSMMRSLTATWTRVYAGSPSVRYDQTKTIAVHGAAARM